MGAPSWSLPRPFFPGRGWVVGLLVVGIVVLGLLGPGTSPALAQPPDALPPEQPEQEEPEPQPGQQTEQPAEEGEDAAGGPASEEAVSEEAASEEAVSEEPDPTRIRFSLPVPEEKGGGLITGTAGAFDAVEEEYAVLTGGVELQYQDTVFRAERVRYDQTTGVLEAEGDVVVEEGPRRLTAATATWNLDTETGSFTDAEARVSEDYFFTGARVTKVEPDVYTVEDGTFTSCNQEVPHWSFHVARARVRVDGYAKARNAAFRVKKAPVLFTPYILWPVRDDRTSGFLVPQPGYSSRRGASISLAYYQVLGRSYDTTFELDAWSDGFVGLGNEFRYQPSQDTEGTFLAYAVDDPDDDEVRWKAQWDHETRNLPGGMRGVIKYRDFSDFDFFREFERDFDDNTIRSLDSRGFLTGNWGPHSLNVLFNRRETFINPQRTVTLTKLPEVEYRLRPTRLGPVPLYLEVESSLDFLQLDRSESLQSDYLRGHFFPTLTLPVRTVPWLSASLTAGERVTWYGDRLRTEEELAARGPEDISAFAGDSLTRTVPFGAAEIIGPSFSRIYEGSEGGKLKHVVEPRWTYTFLDEFEDEDLVPLFDEVDNLRSTNVGRFALINRFLAKPAGEGASAREVLSLELAQSFSFDDQQPLQRGFVPVEDPTGEILQQQVSRKAGPLTGLLRYNPRPGVSLKTEVAYNTLFDEVERTSVSGSYGKGGNSLTLSWFTRTRPDVGESTQNQVRLGGVADILPGKFRFRGQVNYDFEQGLLQQQRYIFDYTGQCCSISFEVRDFQSGVIRDTDYRLAVTLKNVGTFLDLTGGFSNRPR